MYVDYARIYVYNICLKSRVVMCTLCWNKFENNETTKEFHGYFNLHCYN